MCRIKNSYPITIAGHGCGIPSLRTGLLSATPAARTTPSETIEDPVGRPCWPDPCWAAHHRPVGALRWRVRRPLRLGLRVAGRIQTVPGRLDPRERTAEPRCGSGLPCPPARWVGRSLATRPRAVTPGERPEDPPARGDRHRARLGVRQGPQMQLLAEARRPPSVHPADLRLALPGLPHPRPGVLQPRRPAVSGAGQRADGGGAGPAVAGQGGRQAPHYTRRRGP